jgi:hypothetical protein
MVTFNRDGSAAFRIYLPHAGSVELIGDFTDWQASPLAMERDDDGWWSADLPVQPGDHRFSYVVDGAYWMPDYAASGVEHTANGQWVSRLRIPADGLSIDRPIPGRRGARGLLDPVTTIRDEVRGVDADSAEYIPAPR